jgi:hypothetical protein
MFRGIPSWQILLLHIILNSLGYGLNDRGSIPGGATAYRPALGPNQPHIQWVPGAKRSGREALHSTPSSAEVKITWSYTSIPHTPSRRGA